MGAAFAVHIEPLNKLTTLTFISVPTNKPLSSTLGKTSPRYKEKFYLNLNSTICTNWPISFPPDALVNLEEYLGVGEEET